MRVGGWVCVWALTGLGSPLRLLGVWALTGPGSPLRLVSGWAFTGSGSPLRLARVWDHTGLATMLPSWPSGTPQHAGHFRVLLRPGR